MNLETLRELFDRTNSRYETLSHDPAYTAQEAAAAAHVPGHQFCKTVIVFAGGQALLLVLPAPHLVDLARVSAHLGHGDVRLASEEEMARLFPDCDVGAMPPFPADATMKVCVDEELAGKEEIVFPAGLHNQAVRMPMEDYLRLVSPAVFSFGTERAETPMTRAGATRAKASLHEAIARRAYEIYAARGYEHGYDLDDWLRAEAELTAARKKKASA